MKENFDKLPKWAQQKINVLERNLASEKLRCDEAFGTLATDITFSVRLNDSHNLPRHSRITFDLGYIKNQKGKQIDCRITDDGKLIITGDGRIKIYPEASNLILLDIE